MSYESKLEMQRAYEMAQRAMADLKAAVRMVLAVAPSEGMQNAEIGRALGIYQGHVGHEGHISRSLLAALQTQGVADQDTDTKKWKLCHLEDGINDDSRDDS